eukprot:COSAG01_NODE_66_length_29241_cov_17.772768_25_plen_145_part_00
MPFFDDCLKHDVALSVSSLHKYSVLYEQCANLPDKEVGIMMADLSALVDNPKCAVNTTGVHVRGKKPFSTKSWAVPGTGLDKLCIDDDKALGKYYPGMTCVKAAASGVSCHQSLPSPFPSPPAPRLSYRQPYERGEPAASESIP